MTKAKITLNKLITLRQENNILNTLTEESIPMDTGTGDGANFHAKASIPFQYFCLFVFRFLNIKQSNQSSLCVQNSQCL